MYRLPQVCIVTFRIDTCRATLCEYNDTKRSPVHRNFGTSKWPNPTGCGKFPHTSCIGHSMEWKGTERNDGTECFLKLKLAAYHCCTSYWWHLQQVTKCTPKKDRHNLRIDCGFLLVVISNEVLIVGLADSSVFIFGCIK